MGDTSLRIKDQRIFEWPFHDFTKNLHGREP